MRATRRPKALTSTKITATPLLVFGAMLSASLAMRCASKSDPGDETGNGGSSTGGTVGVGGTISPGGAAGAQGAACSVASVANDCPLPPSFCQDGLHLGYYTNPRCVAGRCTYDVESLTCPLNCASSACGSSTTTVMIGPPPPDPRCLGGTSGAGGSSGAGGAGDGGAMGARIIPAGAGGFGGMGGMGAMGTTGCELPPSSCVDATTLLYYTEPRCDPLLQCMYTQNTLDCMGPCTNGACQGGFTAPAPP